MKTKGCEEAVQGRLFEKEELAEASLSAEEYFGKAGTIHHSLREIRYPMSIFNARIFNENGNIVWYGDLEAQQARKGLLALSAKVGSLYVHYGKSESCENEKLSPAEVRESAVVSVERGRVSFKKIFLERMCKLTDQVAPRRKYSQEYTQERTVSK